MGRYLTWALIGAFGISAFGVALGFGYGSGPRVGSAVFPLLMSGGIILVAAWGLAVNVSSEADIPQGLELRPLLAVTGAVVIFIVAIDRLGLVPAAVMSMTSAYLGQTERGYALFLVYSVLFSVAVWLLFTEGLGMPVDAFGGR